MNNTINKNSPKKYPKVLALFIFLSALVAPISWASHLDNHSIRIEGEVLKAVYPKEPLARDLGVCLLILSQQEKISVVIEDGTQCFYTRKFRRAVGQKVSLEESVDFFPQNEEVISSVRDRMNDWPSEEGLQKSNDELDFLPDSMKFFHLELE